METTYKFTAYNKESHYGYGTEDEAMRYLDLLNEKLCFNLYEKEISGLTDEQSEDISFSLCQVFIEIDDIEEKE